MKLLRIVQLGIDSVLINKFALGTNDLLQPRPEPSAPSLGGLPGNVAEDLHDGDDQGLFFVRGSVNISPRYTAL